MDRNNGITSQYSSSLSGCLVEQKTIFLELSRLICSEVKHQFDFLKGTESLILYRLVQLTLALSIPLLAASGN